MRNRKKSIGILFILTSIITMLLLASEFAFDFIEIGFGGLLEMTNALRPKTGTVWQLNTSDLAASERLSQLVGERPIRKLQTDISNFSDLKNVLEEKDTIFITKDQFLKIYNELPAFAARAIVPPLDLLKVIQSRQWIGTKIVRTEKNINFFLMDGNNQLLFDSYPEFSMFYNIPLHLNTETRHLDTMEEFRGRVISAEQFYMAFCELPNSLKLQLINDPFFLIRYNEQIENVAISKYAKNGTIDLGFEINNRSHNIIQIFQSSTISANYLMSSLNAQYNGLNLSFVDSENEIVD